jgi:hypothetical protein
MVLSEKLQHYIRKLPASSQSEVLNFVQYLLEKGEREQGREEELEWSSLSISSAMRGMEDEEGSIYSESDLKEKFS